MAPCLSVRLRVIDSEGDGGHGGDSDHGDHGGDGDD